MKIAVMIFSYLIGSILTGDIVARLKNVDLRNQGSGNVGATNVLRNMGSSYGALVLIGDAPQRSCGRFVRAVAGEILRNRSGNLMRSAGDYRT